MRASVGKLAAVVACAGLSHCAIAPTPRSCPDGHYEKKPIRSIASDGEDCRDSSFQTGVYDSKGNLTGYKTETQRTCTPRFKPGPVQGYKDVWVCSNAGSTEAATLSPQERAQGQCVPASRDNEDSCQALGPDHHCESVRDASNEDVMRCVTTSCPFDMPDACQAGYVCTKINDYMTYGMCVPVQQ